MPAKPVKFVGVGPGDPDLITLKGLKAIKQADLIIYAGSLIPEEMLTHAKDGATFVDSSAITLEEIIKIIEKATANNQEIVRLHSGDLSLYSAVNEQCQELKKLNIPYLMIPGIPVFSAASALMGLEFTVPEKSQTIILTRYPGKASKMPDEDKLIDHVKSSSSVIVHLAITALQKIVRELTPILGESYKIAVLYRIGWSDEKMIIDRLDKIRAKVKAEKITRQAVIIITPALQEGVETRSNLYSKDYGHLFRELKA